MKKAALGSGLPGQTDLVKKTTADGLSMKQTVHLLEVQKMTALNEKQGLDWGGVEGCLQQGVEDPHGP